MEFRRFMPLTGLAALLASAPFVVADRPVGPAYQIVLRSRHAEATPTRTKDAQTGGGWIVVEQPEAHTVAMTMGGSAVAGSDLHGSSAAIDFHLEQDLEIVPMRAGARPPRIGMVGRVVGTMLATDSARCCNVCGSAEQGPAAAHLSIGGSPLLSVNVKQSGVVCSRESSINFRDGPVEAQAVPGCYRLTGTFRIAANQGKSLLHRQYAVADFDPAPQLDAFWADALRPFRAVPRQDFGFRIVVRVIEEPAP